MKRYKFPNFYNKELTQALILQLIYCKISVNIKVKEEFFMNVHSYTSSSGRDLIMDYINSLTEDEQVDAFSVLECMENGEFEKILFKRWQKKIYEVYFRKHNRIFYVTVDEQNIYLRYACRKQKNQTEKKTKKSLLNEQKNLEKF